LAGSDLRHRVSFDQGATWQYDGYVAPNGGDNGYVAGVVADGVIVVAGDPGIVTSSDGNAWAITSAVNAHGAAATFAQGRFVVVSHDVAYTSRDGATWDAHANTGAGDHWHSIAYGNGYFVAFADFLSNGQACGVSKRSTDGATWTDYAVDCAFDDGGKPMGVGVGDVGFGNGLFVMGDPDGHHATSQDGVTWSPRVHDTDKGFGKIQFIAGQFWSFDGYTSTSISGADWTFRNYGPNSATFMNGLFIGMDWTGKQLSMSSDGLTWSPILDLSAETDHYDASTASPGFNVIMSGYLR
jgi:hypothetical protein